MKENLLQAINEIRNDSSLLMLDEASIKSGVVLRLLSLLGWNPFDVTEVKPEYTVESKRVDFSLRINSMNKAFIEVKRPNEDLEPHQEQLLGYSFREGVKIAILTNGLTWWFYLPLNEGSWEQRRFFTADFAEQPPESIAERIVALLSKANVASGNAVKNAEDLYQSRQRKDILRQALPKAWHKLINDPDDLLVDLLIETTERLSGFRPEIGDAQKFLESVSHPAGLDHEVAVARPPKKVERARKQTIQPAPVVSPMSSVPSVPNSTGSLKHKKILGFSFQGKKYPAKTWKDLLATVSEVIHQEHPSQFSKVLSIRGSKRIYFSQSENQLREPRAIGNSGFYVETHWAADAMTKISYDLLSRFGYQPSDLVIDFKWANRKEKGNENTKAKRNRANE
jgi:predicted type IV restriction endonuclease